MSGRTLRHYGLFQLNGNHATIEKLVGERPRPRASKKIATSLRSTIRNPRDGRTVAFYQCSNCSRLVWRG